MSMKRIVPLTALALVLAGAVVGTVRSRRPAQSVQTTVQVVRLRLLALGKEMATLSTPDGAIASMSREGGETIALTPSMQADGLSLTVGLRDALTGDVTVVGRYSLVRNVPLDVSTARTPLVVEWLETISQPAYQGPTAAGPCRTCCVICDGVTFCACEVTTSCGHCCCKNACTCVDGAA